MENYTQVEEASVISDRDTLIFREHNPNNTINLSPRHLRGALRDPFEIVIL
jgi:hypothetical protein